MLFDSVRMPSREDTRQALGDTNTVDCVKHRECVFTTLMINKQQTWHH